MMFLKTDGALISSSIFSRTPGVTPTWLPRPPAARGGGDERAHRDAFLRHLAAIFRNKKGPGFGSIRQSAHEGIPAGKCSENRARDDIDRRRHGFLRSRFRLWTTLAPLLHARAFDIARGVFRMGGDRGGVGGGVISHSAKFGLVASRPALTTTR